MKIIVLASLVATALAADCPEGEQKLRIGAECTCNGATCAADKYCKTAGADDAEKCAAAPVLDCAANTGLVLTVEAKDKCNCKATADGNKGSSNAADLCAKDTTFCHGALAEGKRCIPKCANEAGSLVIAADGDCNCGASDNAADICAATKACKAAGDKGARCLAAAEVKCANKDGTVAVEDADGKKDCNCGGDATNAADICAAGKFCDGSAAAGARCLAEKKGAKAATTTTTAKGTTAAGKATTKAAAAAGTTAAASAATSASITPAAAEAAAKVAHAAALVLMKSVTKEAMTAALAVGKPTAVETPTVKTFEAGKGATVTATITGDPNADAALKKTLDTYFCGLMKIPVDMCKATYAKAARVLADNERRLAGTKMDVAIAMKTEAEYAKEKKDAAAAAQKTLSSGATSFGVAAAMGLVAVLY